MAGRPKKPLAIVRMEGNPGKRRLPTETEEIRPDLAIPECPEWLDEDAQTEWKRIAPDLLTLGLLSNLDMAALAGYCQAYSRWKEAEGKDQTDTAIKYLSQIKRSCSEFGLTPSARAKMSIPGKKDEDEMDELLNHGKQGVSG